MELKEFIKQSVSDMIDAVAELKDKYNTTAIIKNSQIIYEKNPIAPKSSHIDMGIHKIDFDIAITSSETNSEKSGGKIGIKVIDAGIDKKNNCTTENASRVRFSIPFYPEYIDKNHD